MVRKSSTASAKSVVSASPMSSVLLEDVHAAAALAQFDSPVAPAAPEPVVAVEPTLLPAVFTLGILGHNAFSFFNELRAQGIDCVLDVRFARSMFDSRVSFANAEKAQGEQLQQLLRLFNIQYIWAHGLSMTKELATIQNGEEARAARGRRPDGNNRRVLGQMTAAAYEKQCAEYPQWAKLLSALSAAGCRRIAVIEYHRYSAGSIRSIAARHLAERMDCELYDIQLAEPAKPESEY